MSGTALLAERRESSRSPPAAGHPPVRCACGYPLFDGQAIRARVLLVQPDGAVTAKCRCKRWVLMPLRHAAP